jgi:hypothetical protein
VAKKAASLTNADSRCGETCPMRTRRRARNRLIEQEDAGWVAGATAVRHK